jgi:hypothetical protein
MLQQAKALHLLLQKSSPLINYNKNPLHAVEGFFMFKQIYKPNSVLKKEPLSFIYAYCYQQTLAAYPPTIARVRSNVSLHDIAPHRVYLVSLQHYLYILSVALFLALRLVAVNHYDCTMVFGLSYPK